MNADNKQAYLIITHKDDYTFRTLLDMLDDAKNDIFIHMDTKNKEYAPEEIERTMLHSKVFHSTRSCVTWGGGTRRLTQSCYC